MRSTLLDVDLIERPGERPGANYVAYASLSDSLAP